MGTLAVMEFAESIRDESDRELARSSGALTLALYPAAVVLAAAGGALPGEDFKWGGLALSLFCLLGGYRWSQARAVLNQSARGGALQAAILGQALVTSLFYGSQLFRYGTAWPGQYGFLALFGSAALASLSLQSNLGLLRIYLTLMLVPAALGTALSDPARLAPFALMVALSGAFLHRQAALSNQRFRETLNARAEIEVARAREAERAELEAQQRNQMESRQQELMESRRAAEHASRAKGDFLATMSHEIRTPMNAIFGMSELLVDSPLSEQQKDWAETIRTSCEALLCLINDILDFSKIESGKLEVSFKSVDVRRCLQEALTLVSKAADQKEVKLVSHVADEVPPFILTDGGRLRQILLNLLSNAVKFTQEGSVTVRVEHDGTHLNFSLEDSGIGIPSDRMHRLFQSFSQVDSSTTRMYGGTGLGLVISQRLCEKLGGQIWVESGGAVAGRPPADYRKSKTTQGSTFCFSISAEPAEAPAVVPTHELPPDIVKCRNLPVLVVEDNPVNQKVLLQMLKRFQVRATAVDSGHEALEALKEKAYPMVLMDIQMPGMDGYATTIAIRKRFTPTHPWIVAITANAFQEDREACLKMGMNDYLSKPVRQAELMAAFQRFITQRAEKSSNVAG